MNGYARKVALVTANGEHLRWVPAAFAAALVENNGAYASETKGRCREIFIARPVSSYASRIGNASTGFPAGVRFHRWRRLDESASRIVEHHPRCLY
jgi:hypothetical protein